MKLLPINTILPFVSIICLHRRQIAYSFIEFIEIESAKRGIPMQPQNPFYENMLFPDSALPVIFHFDRLTAETEFIPHWQDSIELLYFTKGQAEITSDTQRAQCAPGDVAWINSGHIHSVRALTELCGYYCLIVDRNFFDRQEIPVADLSLTLQISDTGMQDFFDGVIREMLDKKTCYKAAVRAYLTGMAVHMCRNYQILPDAVTPAQSRRILMVKDAIRYIQKNFMKDMTVDDVSAAAGFSKYYLCRGFREITGHTVVDYLNLTRCSHARHLLSSGKYNVSESAERSGFTNLSYFTKTYKRYMGVLPSHEERGI